MFDQANNNFDNDFFQVYKWMITELNLKGLERDIYAIIYGYSRNGINKFYGSLKYLCTMTNSTKPGVIKALKSLLAKGLIEKQENIINPHLKTVVYHATNVQHTVGLNNKKEEKNEPKEPEITKNDDTGRSTQFTPIQNESGKLSLQSGKLSLQSGKLSLPNNIYINNNKAASSSEQTDNIKNKVEELFHGQAFDDSFYLELSEYLYKKDSKDYPGFIDYVYEKTIEKKPKSITKMFYTLCFKSDIYQDFLYSKNNTSGKQPLITKPVVKKICPNCGKTEFSITEKVYGICKCGWDFDHNKIIEEEEIAN